MTHFFPYDELTWPEVAALRRDTPLVIPLGEGYDPVSYTHLDVYKRQGMPCWRATKGRVY